MLVDEARTLARLSHPHIVTLHEVGHDRDELFLSMELVDGVSLSRILQVARAIGTPCGAEVAIEVGAQMADALDYAHTLTGDDAQPLELVHRDVSPQNMLVMPSGHLKLADFGIARSVDRSAQTEVGLVKGKLAYLSPEQLRGEEYDHRVDLYGLGVVMFELITGEQPVKGNDATVELRKRLGGPIDRRGLDGPPALVELIQHLLDPDVHRRPANAAEVRRVLAPLRDEERARARLAELVKSAILRREEDPEDRVTRPM
jgi:serine/threonine-protein kinase